VFLTVACVVAKKPNKILMHLSTTPIRSPGNVLTLQTLPQKPES